MSLRKALLVVLAGVLVVGVASVAASEFNVVDQTKGLLGISASCDDLEFSDLKRDFPEKSDGLGLAFRPYAEALEKCGTLVGQDRRFVRSIFGSNFDSDSEADSWVIEYGSGFFDESRSMAIYYSKADLVEEVDVRRLDSDSVGDRLLTPVMGVLY